MSGRFVRASKYRHVFGQPAKKEICYDNLKVSTNAWDSNLIKANGKYISVNWNSSGGGAFAVIPVDEIGKAPDQVPLFRGHTATVLDTDFNPFNDDIIISGSDDTKVGIWKVPEDYSFHNYVDGNNEVKDVAPVALYSGHKRKVGHVSFHPTAENVAASSSLDYTVKLWDVEKGKDNITLQHNDLVTSFSFNYNGNLLATTSRDRKLRVWDIRSNKIISSGAGHTGAKASRVVWLGNSDRIGTTGFSKLSDRQMGVWDSSNIQAGPIGGFYSIDASAGILIPFYDDSNKILYVGGKGDGNIRYYEFQDDELYPLSEFQSIDAQRGLAIAPKRTVNIAENEVAKAYKTVKDSIIEPISFIVPRKAEVFQDDIYPDAPSSKPALSAEEWFGGNSVEGPILVSMEDIYNKTEPTLRPSVKTETKKEGPKAEEPPKEEPEKEERREPPELVAERSKSASLTPPKSNVDDLLKKNEVNSLLKKAAALDGDEEEPKEEKNDAWDEESEPLKASNDKDGQIKKEEQKPEQKPEAKKEEQKPEQKLEAKKEEQKPEQKLEAKKEEQKPEQKLEEKKNEPKPEQKLEAKKDEPKEGPMSFKSETKTEAASKPLTLKGSIDKLAQVVDGFEKIVSRLEAANLEKDERLKALEDKIAQLLAEK